MLLSEFFAPQMNEGGAVFPETVAIKKEYVPDIVKQIKKLLAGMNVHPDIGSAGYKIASGDMDVMIDAQELADKFGAADVKAAKKALQELLGKKNLETKLSGQNVHVKMPLPDGSFGQVDIMIIPDAKMVAPYHQHGPRGSYEDPGFKGSEIFILIASIAKSMNLKFEPFGAKLVKRDTGDLVARSRDDVARILLNPNATGDDLNSVKSIMNALKDDPKKEEKLAQARADAEKGLIKLPEAKEPNQLKGTDIAKTIAPRPFAGSQPHPFRGKLVGGESANPAQQAAIAIAKKKAGMNEEGNPTDTISMDIPLFIRMMEYAREDSKTDMDLHNVTERAIKLMQGHDYLCMDNYKELVGGELTGGEKPVEEAATEHEAFSVHIPANIYDGRYYDYRTVAYRVLKGQDGVETEQDAIDWVNSHKEQVLAELDRKRVRVGERLVRKIAKPADKNVFFKDTYQVRATAVTKPAVSEEQVNEASGYSIVNDLVAAFNQNTSGSKWHPLDATRPGSRVWTRGDGSKYRDPGVVSVSKYLEPGEDPKDPKKIIADFWDWLKSVPGVKPHGKIRGEFRSDSYSDIVTYRGLYFARGQFNITWGSASRFKKNPSVWHRKDDEVKEDKIKGADGKACWDGYRYAGTEKGKDKCIPVKKAK